MNLAHNQDPMVFYNAAYLIQELHAAGDEFLLENRMKIKLQRMAILPILIEFKIAIS